MQWYLDLAARLPIMVLLLISVTGVITGDLLAKFWSANHKPWLFVMAIIFYLVSPIFYMPTLLREGLIITSLIWSLLSIIGFLMIGLIIFHETLTPVQITGVILGSIAVLLLTVGH